MNMFKTLAVATTLTIAAVTALHAETFAKGVVKKIDAEADKVTIIHEELVDLDMPPMTMVFELADPEMTGELSEGMEIEFVVARVNGKLTVTKLR